MRYSPDKRKQVLDDIMQGRLTVKEAATKHDVGIGAIYGWLREEKVNSADISTAQANPLPNGFSDRLEAFTYYVVYSFFGFDTAEANQFCRERHIKKSDLKRFGQWVENYGEIKGRHEIEEAKNQVILLQEEVKRLERELDKSRKIIEDYSLACDIVNGRTKEGNRVRGLSSPIEKDNILKAFDEGRSLGLSDDVMCKVLGTARRTIYCWRNSEDTLDRRVNRDSFNKSLDSSDESLVGAKLYEKGRVLSHNEQNDGYDAFDDEETSALNDSSQVITPSSGRKNRSLFSHAKTSRAAHVKRHLLLDAFDETDNESVADEFAHSLVAPNEYVGEEEPKRKAKSAKGTALAKSVKNGSKSRRSKSDELLSDEESLETKLKSSSKAEALKSTLVPQNEDEIVEDNKLDSDNYDDFDSDEYEAVTGEYDDDAFDYDEDESLDEDSQIEDESSIDEEEDDLSFAEDVETSFDDDTAFDNESFSDPALYPVEDSMDDDIISDDDFEAVSEAFHDLDEDESSDEYEEVVPKAAKLAKKSAAKISASKAKRVKNTPKHAVVTANDFSLNSKNLQESAKSFTQALLSKENLEAVELPLAERNFAADLFSTHDDIAKSTRKILKDLKKLFRKLPERDQKALFTYPFEAYNALHGKLNGPNQLWFIEWSKSESEDSTFYLATILDLYTSKIICMRNFDETEVNGNGFMFFLEDTINAICEDQAGGLVILLSDKSFIHSEELNLLADAYGVFFSEEVMPPFMLKVYALVNSFITKKKQAKLEAYNSRIGIAMSEIFNESHDIYVKNHIKK